MEAEAAGAADMPRLFKRGFLCRRSRREVCRGHHLHPYVARFRLRGYGHWLLKESPRCFIADNRHTELVEEASKNAAATTLMKIDAIWRFDRGSVYCAVDFSALVA